MQQLLLDKDIFKNHSYNIKTQNLTAERISCGGNYIYMKNLPQGKRFFVALKNDFNSAIELNSANKGFKVVDFNKDMQLLIFNEFFIWTEGTQDSNDNSNLEFITSGSGEKIFNFIGSDGNSEIIANLTNLANLQQQNNSDLSSLVANSNILSNILTELQTANVGISTLINLVGSGGSNANWGTTWTNVTNERAFNTDYTNDNKFRAISFDCQGRASATTGFNILVNNTNVARISFGSNNNYFISAIIPPNATYKVTTITAAPPTYYWWELL